MLNWNIENQKKKYKKEVKNKDFARKDPLFLEACRLATEAGINKNGGGVKPTIRQASRFRAKKGIAYKFYKQAANR